VKSLTRTIVRSTALVALVVACNDSTAPGGGGLNNENRDCQSDHSSGWTNNGLDLNVAKPPCPDIIKGRFSWVDYDAIITVPATKVGFDAFGNPDSYVNASSTSIYTGSTVGDANFVMFQQDPNNQNSYRAEPTFQGTPGSYYSPDTATKFEDSLYVEAQGLVYPFASAWKWLPGRVEDIYSLFVGTSSFAYGASQTWRNEPAWDTTGYTFKWLLNGQLISGATGAKYTSALGPAGTYNLSTIATRADLTADTVTLAVTVTLATPISGPTQPTIGCANYWDASASGGTAPYTYYWTANGVHVGGSTYELQYTPRGPRVTFNVTATDATGKTGSSTFSATPLAGSC
jgi:hypothetical protein